MGGCLLGVVGRRYLPLVRGKYHRARHYLHASSGFGKWWLAGIIFRCRSSSKNVHNDDICSNASDQQN
jgi:hypothetical protein